MIITISGVPGSGKTSVGRKLAERLGYPFESVGELRGKMALERGMDINQLNAVGETDPSTDNPVDEYQRELGRTKDHFIMEGRISWYFIPNSFKILLLCDLNEGAARVMASAREDEGYGSKEEAITAFQARTASDTRRYKKYYDIDNYLDPAHYDFVLDTTHIKGVEAVTDAVEKAVRERMG